MKPPPSSRVSCLLGQIEGKIYFMLHTGRGRHRAGSPGGEIAETLNPADLNPCYRGLFRTRKGLDLQGTLRYTVSIAAAAAKSLQSCPTLCDPIDGSLASHNCYNRLPQVQWLQTSQICHLKVQEVRNLKWSAGLRSFWRLQGKSTSMPFPAVFFGYWPFPPPSQSAVQPF